MRYHRQIGLSFIKSCSHHPLHCDPSSALEIFLSVIRVRVGAWQKAAHTHTHTRSLIQ